MSVSLISLALPLCVHIYVHYGSYFAKNAEGGDRNEQKRQTAIIINIQRNYMGTEHSVLIGLAVMRG